MGSEQIPEYDDEAEALRRLSEKRLMAKIEHLHEQYQAWRQEVSLCSFTDRLESEKHRLMEDEEFRSCLDRIGSELWAIVGARLHGILTADEAIAAFDKLKAEFDESQGGATQGMSDRLADLLGHPVMTADWHVGFETVWQIKATDPRFPGVLESIHELAEQSKTENGETIQVQVSKVKIKWLGNASKRPSP